MSTPARRRAELLAPTLRLLGPEMVTTHSLSLPAADGAAPHATTGRAPASRSVGTHSLRELVDHAVAEAEVRAIRQALASARGNKSLAARILRTNYTTLHLKMKRLGISAREFRPS